MKSIFMVVLFCLVGLVSISANNANQVVNQSISGVVTDKNNNGLGGISVVVNLWQWDEDGSDPVYLGSWDTVTDANGNYSFPGILPGNPGAVGRCVITVWDGDAKYVGKGTEVRWMWFKGLTISPYMWQAGLGIANSSLSCSSVDTSDNPESGVSVEVGFLYGIH
jgi:hypothetical protein